MPPTPTLPDAIALARAAHAGQTDKAGAPYFGHLDRVMSSLPAAETDARIVAILHDILEDTPTTREDLLAAGYPAHIVSAIEALSKRPDEQGADDGYTMRRY